VAIGGALLAAGAHAIRRTVLKKPGEKEDSEEFAPENRGDEK